MWRSCIALALVACIDEPPSCEAMVCEIVPACSPLTTGAWDWRSEAACQAPLAHAVMDQLWCGMTDMLGVERVEIVCDMLAAHGLAEGGPSSYRRRLKRSS